MDPKVLNAKDLPTDTVNAPDGLYAVKSAQSLTLEAEDEDIRTKIWFRTPPLDQRTIQRINKIQLYAESRDQGYADDPSAGNWTWFEFVILDSPSTDVPRTIGGVNLVWRSHYNRFLSNEFDWAEGDQYGKSLVGLLKPGNVLAVRLSARFAGWKIMAKEGVLIIELTKPADSALAPNFKEVIQNVEAIQHIFKEANDELDAAFEPEAPDSVYRADSFISANQRPIRVLSLDGGGIRGLSSLYILKEVMKIVSPDGKLKPWQVFDMIGGTSTGGLIAIMLGRLRMDVDTCIQKYTDFVGKIFNVSLLKKGWNLKTKGSFYDTTILENLIKSIVADALKDENATLLHDDDACRVFVTAVRADAANNRAPVILRSYKNENKLPALPEIKVWESARATSAAPAYFNPITVGKYELVDGGLGANNPLGWLWNEVLDVFGPARRTGCFLSIGTGIPKNFPLAKAGLFLNTELAKSMSAIATNSQLTHILFKGLLNAYAPAPRVSKYWRMNVGVEIPDDNYVDVGDLDDLSKLKALLDMTQDYIKAQTDIIKSCADTLKASL